MIEGYPELFYLNDSSIDPKFNQYCYSFFDTIHDPDDNRYLSEDYTYCRRWQKIGGSIWLDPNTNLNAYFNRWRNYFKQHGLKLYQ